MQHSFLPARFEVLETVARSGAETLLRAKDTVLAREVLLKVSPRETGTSDRFLREARMLARVKHPGVARLWDVLDLPEGVVLVLEPVAGECLADRLARRGTLDVEETRRLAVGVALALEAVHAAGVVHRNLAVPSIYLRPDESPLLAGFSFAKPGDPTTRSSIDYQTYTAGAGAFPAYPAPEQIAGQPADVRSDLFALGCLLYRCVTGAEAYPEGVGAGRPADPAHARPGLPPDLAEAIRKCLAPSPSARFGSAREFRKAIGLPVSAGAPGAGGAPHARSGHRRSFLFAASATALLVLAVFGLRLLRNDAPSSPLAENTTRGRRVVPAERGTLTPRYENSYALLIGVGPAYQSTEFRVLPNAERDVTDLAARLTAMPWENWKITTLLGSAATADSIRRALTDLGDRARPDDRVFVYYAGHGERHPRAEESGWIIPVDAVPLDRDPSRKNWYRFDEFEKFFAECAAKHIFVALDCCYSGIGVMATREASTRPYSESFLTRKAHVLLASSREDEPALDGPPHGHSPFAQAFLDALKDSGRGPLTTTELGLLVQKEFAEAGFPQTPLLGYHTSTAPERSEFVFFRGRSE